MWIYGVFKMTRTTELLKALEKSQRRNTCKETKEEHKLRIEAELRGRLDALKEVLNLDENGARDDDYLIINKNKIQEEIKMVESAGVGK
jgi:hypothetical protein